MEQVSGLDRVDIGLMLGRSQIEGPNLRVLSKSACWRS